jgi:hypothetical protein
VESTAWIAIIVAFLGVATSSATAILAYRLSRQSQRSESQREIGRSYEKMMDFRTSYPDVLSLSRRWTEECFVSIYNQKSERDRQWARYYTYVELCTSFVNAVLYAREAGLLDKRAFENQYRNLVKLLLTEHYPYLTTILDGKYLSKYVLAFLQELEHGGWNWLAMHEQLAEVSADSRKVVRGANRIQKVP